jgi:hypothetical protein
MTISGKRWQTAMDGNGFAVFGFEFYTRNEDE